MLAIGIGIILIFFATPAEARESGVMAASPSFFVESNYGLSTYKSKLLESNDTGTGLSYALGGFAGDDREFGFRYRVDTSKINFELNKSALASTWADSTMRYRLTYLYAGVVFGNVTLEATKTGNPFIDLVGSGMGYNGGLLIPIGRIAMFQIDYTSVTMSQVKNELKSDSGKITLGARTDIDLQGIFNLSDELLDSVFGYQMRSYTVNAGQSYAESYAITYAGLRLSLYF